MGLSRLGDFLELVDERNENLKFGAEDVRGISTSKCFIATKANLSGVDLSGYKVVGVRQFAYVADTSRRNDKIALAYCDDKPCIISSVYTVFKVRDEGKLLSRYLMMFFNRPEFDKYARFNSWGSARETFDWEDFCNIRLEIPPLDIQKKYVGIYEGLLANLRSYEKGLDDLKLVCDGYIEDLRKKWPMAAIGSFLELVDERNENLKFGAEDVRGISTSKCFIATKANLSGVDLSGYKVVGVRQFAYVADTSRRNDKIALAYCDDKPCIISSVYTVFKVRDEGKLLSRYLMMFFNRPEFDRYARFNSWGSARETFDWDTFGTYRIPVAPIEVQKSICLVYETYLKRKNCFEKLKAEINSICPILIKGSFEKDA